MMNETQKEPMELTREVWSAQALADLLGCNKKQLVGLRINHGLPLRRLQQGLYVGLTAEVIDWLRARPIVGSEESDAPHASTSHVRTGTHSNGQTDRQKE